MNTNNKPRPATRFDFYTTVKVPKEVYEGKSQPVIVGYEWSDDNRRVKAKGATWIYHVKMEPGVEWVLVSEEELISWGN